MNLFQFDKNQFGRSMTEMLGVLAIIGVLSIGSIAGYRLSMNKLRANELIHEIDMRRVAIYQQLLKDPDNIDMEMGTLTNHGYKISSALDLTEDDVFYISVETIEQGVCQEIMRQNWTAPLDIYIEDVLVQNGDASECNGSDSVDMSFKFDKYGQQNIDTDDDDAQDNDNPDETPDAGEEETTDWGDETTDWDEETTDWEEETTDWDETNYYCGDNQIRVDDTCYSCSQYEAISAWDSVELIGCSNRTISCATGGTMDCYSYLKTCPSGYSETGRTSCNSGEIPINDGSDVLQGAPTGCCAK